MEQRITFLTLGVADLSASIDFYENKFGWTRSEMSNDDFIVFSLEGFRLALYPRHELAADATVSAGGSGFRAFSMSYNVDTEVAVDELVNVLRSRGVLVLKEPQKVFWGGYSCYVADPDGNLWEIAYNPFLS